MLDALKRLLRGTALEQPARRVFAAVTRRRSETPSSSKRGNPDSWTAPQGDQVHGEPPAEEVDINATYDAQTFAVMARVLTSDAVSVDVGCHAGQILDEMRRLAPHGHHYAFEPLPDLFQSLRERYPQSGNVTLHNMALSDAAGTFTFQHVVSNPGYSGFRKRRYDRPEEQVVETEVTAVRLDQILPEDTRVSLIKIDVEGAELQVLQGARETLRRDRPVVVFEHGLGAADVYGTRPEQVYDLLSEFDLNVFLMSDWLAGGAALSRGAFADEFDSGRNFYFMAAP